MKLRTLSPRQLAGAAGLACAAALIPVAALAVSTASPAAAGTAAHRAAAVALARCGIAHPALPGGAFVWSGNPGDGFAGGQSYELEITNTGHHACTLRGVPAVAAVLNDGRLIGKRVPGSRKGPLVTLRPGATAHVSLVVNDAGALCPASNQVIANVVVYLPGQTKAQPTFMTAQVCRGKPGGGVLHISGLIHAGTGIPLYNI
jgi:hypothetical protein